HKDQTDQGQHVEEGKLSIRMLIHNFVN
ncbi:MAG: hypothetical protein UT42_C0029G0014, partial [Candidatus Falkowbacteria bacterium GW2011_GWA2_39_24]